MFVRSYLFVPISAYNYFYMTEIIRVARSMIPATELTFLSRHMYLYSKGKIDASLDLHRNPSLDTTGPLRNLLINFKEIFSPNGRWKLGAL